MIEKSVSYFAARSGDGLLDLNHTRNIVLASVVQIAKSVPSVPENVTNFAITTLAHGRNENAAWESYRNTSVG